MAVTGRALLMLALAAAAYAVFASLYGARLGADGTRGRAWAASGRRALWALAGVLTVAWVILEAAFLRLDFGFQLVVDYSSTTTTAFYRVTAPWSSQAGSLLLWVWLLSLWSSLALFLVRRRMHQTATVATAVLAGFAVFFLALLVFAENPFAQVPGTPPAEGAGLNPLLRNPSMMFHPTLLYSGYTLFAIPFAFAVGALVTRQVGAEWIRATRRFTLAAWGVLGFGILLGSRWSYSELGWGGYWGWDPVENASLMPWLAGTALLHSVMIQEKRGMLKVWNASLALATGTLALLGTFLVRSGILSSIHAFGASTVGVPFFVLIVVMTVASVALVIARRADLRSEHRLDGLLSRESAFLAQNLVLMAVLFVIFWGTFFPLISEALTGTKQSVSSEWYDRYVGPLALALVGLTGIGPLLAWRRATLRALWRSLAVPAAIALLGAFLLVILTSAAERPAALALFGLAILTVAGALQELWRGARARAAASSEALPVAAVSVVRRNRRRYGGYLVHAGIAVLFCGVAASSSFQETKDATLVPGQSVAVGRYDIEYTRAYARPTAEKITFGAVLGVSEDGKPVGTLRTERGFYPSRDPTLGVLGRFFEGSATSEVGLRAGLTRDLWTVINPDIAPLLGVINEGDRRFAAALKSADTPAKQQQLFVLRDAALRGLASRWETKPWPAVFRVIDSPLVSWIWLGGLIVVGGAVLAGWPAPSGARRRITSLQAARLGRRLAERA